MSEQFLQTGRKGYAVPENGLVSRKAYTYYASDHLHDNQVDNIRQSIYNPNSFPDMLMRKGGQPTQMMSRCVIKMNGSDHRQRRSVRKYEPVPVQLRIPHQKEPCNSS